eukprot:COSAG02_NODE_1859_length_10614_cov_53.814075_9_plen_201_part_00
MRSAADRAAAANTLDGIQGAQHSVTDQTESGADSIPSGKQRGRESAGDEREYAHRSEEGVHQEEEDDEEEDYEEYGEEEEEEEEEGGDEDEDELNHLQNANNMQPGRYKNRSALSQTSAQSRADRSDRSDSEQRRLKRHARLRLAESRALVEEKRRAAELEVKQQETERKYLEAMVMLERLQAVRKQEMKRCVIACTTTL